MNDDIRSLPDDGWYPIQVAEQSRYTWSPCERCGGRIEAGERHERRYWKGGLAEFKQHIDCTGREENPLEYDISGGSSSYNRSSYDQVRKPERII